MRMFEISTSTVIYLIFLYSLLVACRFGDPFRLIFFGHYSHVIGLESYSLYLDKKEKFTMFVNVYL